MWLFALLQLFLHVLVTWAINRSTSRCQHEGVAVGRRSAALPTTKDTSEIDDDDIEEGRSAYEPGGFHPVYIGDVYHDRYQVINKLGYGVSSTVWLVKDLKSRPKMRTPYRAMKVLSAGHDSCELEILQHIRSAHSNTSGRKYVSSLLDDFEHIGPNGTHVCLIFWPMGETLGTFGSLFPNGKIPFDLMCIIMRQLLEALDFIHKHGIIHADIKPDNIFVKFQDYALIESKYLIHVPVPQQNREGPYVPVRSSSLKLDYFSRDYWKDYIHDFNFVLGDFGASSWQGQHPCKLAQPPTLRSPEMLIGAEWDESTDIWSFGAAMLEVFRDFPMFRGSEEGAGGPYLVKAHLSEIVHHFDLFPKDLLDKGDETTVQQLFNEDGTVKDAEPMYGEELESRIVMPDRDDTHLFLDFLENTMRVDPYARPKARFIIRKYSWLKYGH